ncbi:MAG TPA: D-glycero-beta-D-manno-heptose 1-phosphate adenylyltransferase [Micrococcaceae bacterium]|jgi:rfaE bifunctional protein nucleotidyltransferase chain/domain/rfaE bifunctional protein kinase chain/domain|nr:D-glycero-beta-D-manno-heptose 1-phosphate adenylyltransferase [Micrococcaceae bacterium]
MRIAVVGDVLLDVDIRGDATRLSPDGPVPVVDVSRIQRRAGGAGLVATLLAADGADVVLVTALADDDGGARLRAELAGISVVASQLPGPTPVKTRLRANGQAIARFDEGCGPAAAPVVSDDMLTALAEADAIVVADYGRGLTADPGLRRVLEGLCHRIPVVWDPHPSGSVPVPGMAAVTPNLAEALQLAAAKNPARQQTVVAAATSAAVELQHRWSSRAVVVTLAEKGALLVQDAAPLPAVPLLVPAPASTVPDSCGAGDRFAASLALKLARGMVMSDAVEAAVASAAAFLAGGGVAALADGGAAAASIGGGAGAAGRGAIRSGRGPEPRRHDLEQAQSLAQRIRASGGNVVATGGCFDLLHAGHVRTLAAARALGDCLIVCLNSDPSIRRLKGPDRPIIEEHDRAELLAALSCVDAVAIFDEDTPEAILDLLRPDLWVKGGDYSAAQLPETDLLQTWGGRTITLPYHPARSTTKLAGALARFG